MILSTSSEAALATRRHVTGPTGATYFHTTFIGTNRYIAGPGAKTPRPGEFTPMAFLVEQDPHTTVKTHFHVADQFQVVVAGKAMLGTHPVEGVAVHFTGPYSPYGPIRAGELGVHYFTLRNAYDSGAQYMPDSRHELRAKRTHPHREAVVDPRPALSPEALAALAEPEETQIIATEADGLAAWRYRLPPGARVAGPDPQVGRGQTWLVLEGTLEREEDGAPLPRHSCLFVHPDDPALDGRAGQGGLEILCLQYPRAAA